jgi:cytochrome c biogenesis protein CcmG, thiol:disulfide interchange protein DsbE
MSRYATAPRACTLIVALLGNVAVLAAPGAEVGQPAPALVVTEFDLAAQKGKVVIVNYWASWCSPCRAEMPALDAFYQRYRAQGLVLIGVSVDAAADRPAVVAIMQKLGYPAALAAGAKVNGFGPPLAVPMTWIIDSRGIVRARLVSGSAVTEQSLSQAVLPLLAQKPRA